MSQITFGPNRAYPSIPTVGNDLVSHSRAIEAIAEAMSIHERRTNEILSSFVRVGELVDLGLIDIDGNIVTDDGSDTDASASHNHDSLYIRLDGSSPATTGTVEFGASISVTGGVSVSGEVTAATFSGIASGDLVDKSADETIAGDWTFTGVVVLPEQAVVDHEAALTILETQITDGALLARVSENETIDGNWTFTGVTILPEAAVTDHEAALTILESQITDGSILARVAANETISGDWTHTNDVRINRASANSALEFNVPSTTYDADIRFDIAGVLTGLIRWDSTNNRFDFYDRDPSSVVQFRMDLETGDFTALTGNVSGTTIGGITEANLVDLSANETITGNWTYDVETIGDFVINRTNDTGASGLLFRNVDGAKGYLGFDDLERFNVWNASATSVAYIDNAGDLHLDGELFVNNDAASLDSTDIGNWNSHIALVNEHLDWTTDTGSVIQVDNLAPDVTPDNDTLTPAYHVVTYDRTTTAGEDFDGFLDSGRYGAGSGMINGPTGNTFDPFAVYRNSSDVRTMVLYPRTNSRGIAYRGYHAAAWQTWHYTGWTTTAADADLSLYQKSASNTLDAVVTNGQLINAGTGTVEIEIPASGAAIQYRVDTTAGSWARGIAYERKSDGARIAGHGLLGSAESPTSFHVGFGSSWWADHSVLDLTSSQFTVGNFAFDIDQTVGAGQDNYVLTYDDASGLISLEAAAGGGGGIDNVVEDLTPQLGGDLDLNGQNITSAVNVNNGIEAGYLGVNSTSGLDGHGLSLYNGYQDGQPIYGIMFAQTAAFGTHESGVTADWATYFTMNHTSGRGWIFRQMSTGVNIMSISNLSNMALGGSDSTYHAQPWFEINSPSTGDNWTSQGAGISIGEGGKKGGAAIHITYNGDGSGYIGMGSVDNTAGTGGRPAFSHIDFTHNSSRVAIGGRLYPGNNSMVPQSVGYIDTPTLRGSINVAGEQAGSYAGYSINNDLILMHNGITGGLYDEVQNHWRFRTNTNESNIRFYNGSVVEAQTVNSDITGALSGFQIKDHSQNMRYAGFANMVNSVEDNNRTLSAVDAGNYGYWDNSFNYNVTTEASSTTDFPIGCRFDLINRTAGTININAGTGCTIYWAKGDGTFPSGNLDLSYGWATILRHSATVWIVTGNGLVASP